MGHLQHAFERPYECDVCQNLTGENNANALAGMLSIFAFLSMSAMGSKVVNWGIVVLVCAR